MEVFDEITPMWKLGEPCVPGTYFVSASFTKCTKKKIVGARIKSNIDSYSKHTNTF